MRPAREGRENVLRAGRRARNLTRFNEARP